MTRGGVKEVSKAVGSSPFLTQTNREMRFKYENNFIQWKGTDVCMDFHCECGEHNHYDGYFAYYVKCSGCGQVYQMDTKVKMKKVDDNDFNPLESEV